MNGIWHYATIRKRIPRATKWAINRSVWKSGLGETTLQTRSMHMSKQLVSKSRVTSFKRRFLGHLWVNYLIVYDRSTRLSFLFHLISLVWGVKKCRRTAMFEWELNSLLNFWAHKSHSTKSDAQNSWSCCIWYFRLAANAKPRWQYGQFNIFLGCFAWA